MTSTDPHRDAVLLAIRQRLELLGREHAEVKARVLEYQRRRWLSAGESIELKTLQRLKLQKKDAIAGLELELATFEGGAQGDGQGG
jgi:hypothetical protein